MVTKRFRPPNEVIRHLLYVLTTILMFIIQTKSVCKAAVIIDHTCTDVSKIPDYWVKEVKKMLLNVPGESHSIAYRDGLTLLASMPGYEKFAVNVSTFPEAPTDAYLRISPGHRNQDNTGWWGGWTGEEHFWTSQAAIDWMKQHLDYMINSGNLVHAFGFGWCYDMMWINPPGGGIDPVYNVRWAGTTYTLDGEDKGIWGLDDDDNELTGNDLNMQDYLDAVDAYNAHVPQTVTFFTTGPVDSDVYVGERGYQRYLKHEFIRNYVRNSQDKVLFDYADILTHNDSGEQNLVSWDGRDYPFIHPDNALTEEPNDTGHIGAIGAIRLGKALWWMMARLAGWDGCAAVGGDFNGDCKVDFFDFAIFANAWSAEPGSPNWNDLCDLAPSGGDGVVNYKDLAVLCDSWLVGVEP